MSLIEHPVNASVDSNSYQGMHFQNTTVVKLFDISAENNTLYGLQLFGCTDIEAIGLNISLNGILVLECSNTSLSNVNVGLIDQRILLFMHCPNVTLANNTFSKVDFITQEDFHIPAIVSVHNTSLILRDCRFIGNQVSSIDASDAIISIEGNILFENISSEKGGAFIFSGSSELIVSEDSHAVFHNNHVTQYGAAICLNENVVTDTYLNIHDFKYMIPGFLFTTQTKCFLGVEGKRTNTARLVFVNNTAEKGGDVLYGGLVATGYDGDWNCLLSFKNISDMTRQSSEQPFRRITSEPSRVCLCGEGGPDCMIVVDPTHHVLYPGQTLTLSAAVVGQDFGTVPGNVFAQFLQPFDQFFPPDQEWIPFSNHGCEEFRYTIHYSCDYCQTVIVLTTNRETKVQDIDSDINRKLRNTWSMLVSDPNYHTLALEYIHQLLVFHKDVLLWSTTDEYDSLVHDAIDGFYTIAGVKNEVHRNGTS